MIDNIIIEPCCFIRQMSENIAKCGDGGMFLFFTNGDVTVNHLLEYLVYHCPGGEVTIALINMELDTLRNIGIMLRAKQADGKPMVEHMMILTQGKQRELIQSELGEYRANGRLTVCEDRIGMRCIAAGNGKTHFVLQGSINQMPNHSMQMMSLSMSKGIYDDVMQVWGSKGRTKKVK